MAGRRSWETWQSAGLGWGMSEKIGHDPKRRVPDWRTTLPLAAASPRCGAKTRSGSPCRAPAMPNGRCRMHGGASTGPRTQEGLERMRRSKTVHGLYSAAYREERRIIRMLTAAAKRTLGRV